MKPISELIINFNKKVSLRENHTYTDKTNILS